MAKIIGREHIISANRSEIIGEILVKFNRSSNAPIYSTYKLATHEDGYVYLEKYLITSETVIIPKFASIVPDGAFVVNKDDNGSYIVEELRVCRGSLLERWNNTQLKDLVNVDFSEASHLKSICRE